MDYLMDGDQGVSVNAILPPVYCCTLILCNLMASKYSVHQHPLELYTPLDLTCQAIESTPSNKPDCPFPAQAGGRAPLILFGELLLTCCRNDLEVPSRRSGKIKLSTLSGELPTRNWSSTLPRRIPFCDCFSFQLTHSHL